MAGQLIQVATTSISNVSNFSITGIDTDDVYLITLNNLYMNTDGARPRLRFTKSSDSSADTTANYDYADKVLNAVGFSNRGITNDTKTVLETTSTTANNETANAIIYLFNFNSSSEYSFYTYEQTNRNQSAQLSAPTGGGVHTVASASDGVQFSLNANNFTSGKFTLFGLKK